MVNKRKPKTLKDLLLNGNVKGKLFFDAPRNMASTVYDFKRGTMTYRRGGIYEIIDLVVPNSRNGGDALIRYLGDRKYLATNLRRHYDDSVATAKEIKDMKKNRYGVIRSLKV